MAPEVQVSRFELISKGALKRSLIIGASTDPVESETIGVEETFHCGFRVRDRDASVEYTILIGDEPLDSTGYIQEGNALTGSDASSDVVWVDGWYFESCVGVVYVHLLARPAETNIEWRTVARLRVNVVPSKLGWERYDSLLRDLKRISAALIFDLFSKNRRAVGFNGVGISVEPTSVQFRRIERIWADFRILIAQICESPATTLVRRLVNTPAGQGMDPKSAWYSVGRGIIPIAGASRVRQWRAVESTRIYEHSLIKGVLLLLLSRLKDCERRANDQAAQLRRDFPVWLDPVKAPEIITNEYLPRIERLEELMKDAAHLIDQVQTVLRLPMFRDLEPRNELILSPVFQGILSYNATFLAILNYLRTSLWSLDEGLEDRVKRTSRLFEHWVYIQLAAAASNIGLPCIEEQGLYSICPNNRFTVDLDKGTALTFQLPSGGLMRLRYEPWILPKKRAIALGDSLYGPVKFAWNPDIVIEFINGFTTAGIPKLKYAVVVDAKYTKRISERHWESVNKYWKIRATHDDRQVAKQLWLAFPSSEPAKPTDECVPWGGPGNLSETIDGTLGLIPTDEAPSTAIPVADNAVLFMSNVLRFLGESPR